MDLDTLLADDSEFVYEAFASKQENAVTTPVNVVENIENTEGNNNEVVIDDETSSEPDNTGEEAQEDLSESPNVAYLGLLTEKGIMSPLSEEALVEFKGLGFEEQTEKLLEIYDGTVLERANTMLDNYLSERPSKLRLIEENYKSGMSEDDAIKFALEAPKMYNPTFDTERDEAYEKSIIMEDYLRMLGGDMAKAEIMFSFDYEKGITKDRAIEISKQKNEAWNNSQKAHLQALEENSAKQLEMFNESKRKYADFLKNTEELLPSMKISKEDKVKLFDAIYKPVVTDNGVSSALDLKINSNPAQANAIMSYLFVTLDILNKPENIERIYKVGKTKQANSIIDTWKKTNVGITNKAVTRVAAPKKLSDYTF